MPALLNLHRSHSFRGAAALPLATITTGDAFPTAKLNAPVTMATRIRILDNGGTHEGLVFEFGSATRGFVLWVQNNRFGIRAGGAPGSDDAAAFVYLNGTAFAAGLEFNLVACAHPGTGKVELWGNGQRLITRTAVNGNFGGGWSDTGDGSFASDPAGTIATDVPASYRQAPDGFEVLEPLSVYAGQLPAFF